MSAWKIDTYTSTGLPRTQNNDLGFRLPPEPMIRDIIWSHFVNDKQASSKTFCWCLLSFNVLLCVNTRRKHFFYKQDNSMGLCKKLTLNKLSYFFWNLVQNKDISGFKVTLKTIFMPVCPKDISHFMIIVSF